MPLQREPVFDFERKGETEEPEEDSGPRSILRLETAPSARVGAAASVSPQTPGRPAATPAPAGPGPPTSDPRRRDPLSLSDTSPVLPDIEVPQFERDLESTSAQPIPIERAILLSLGLHLLLFLVLRWAPVNGGAGSTRGLFGALFPEPKPPDTIPLVFRSAPGPARENPKRSDPSDQTRRAGGGDPSRPRSESPFVRERPGIEGLAPGGGKSARAAPPRAAAGENGERTAAASSETARSTAPDALQIPPPGPSSTGRPGQPLTNLDRAIRDAAREVGAGEAGAGFANPEGGFVDSGPISFDTSWYDWGAYADEMVRRIKLHWEIPELARLGWKGRLTVRFYIMADGRVADAKYISKSGVPPFDFAAFQAIIKSDPFRPLPKDLLLQIPGKDREGITVTFFYNMRPNRE